MKKSLLFLLFILCASYGDAQIRSNKDLIGKWESNALKLEFFSDGRVGLLMQGGNMPRATYKTDFFKNPVLLEITVTQGHQKMSFKAFIEFIDNTTVELQGYDPTDPSAAFMKGRVITLKKIK